MKTFLINFLELDFCCMQTFMGNCPKTFELIDLQTFEYICLQTFEYVLSLGISVHPSRDIEYIFLLTFEYICQRIFENIFLHLFANISVNLASENWVQIKGPASWLSIITNRNRNDPSETNNQLFNIEEVYHYSWGTKMPFVLL